jgi:hypothetical protein
MEVKAFTFSSMQQVENVNDKVEHESFVDESFESFIPNMPGQVEASLTYRPFKCSKEQYNKAMKLADECKEGDLVLYNYSMTESGWLTVAYLKKVGDEMVKVEQSGWKEDVYKNWTYDVCPWKMSNNLI